VGPGLRAGAALLVAKLWSVGLCGRERGSLQLMGKSLGSRTGHRSGQIDITELTLRRRPFVAGVWSALLLLGSTSCRPPAPADAEVIEQFNHSAHHYEQIRMMLAEDRKVGTIGQNFLFEADRPFTPAKLTQIGLTERRLAAYKHLLALAGTKRLDRSADQSVTFMQWAGGYAGNTHHKGIAWLAQPPGPGTDRRFTLIRGQWYLFQD
jgi:hypothetical protein